MHNDINPGVGTQELCRKMFLYILWAQIEIASDLKEINLRICNKASPVST